jgi:AcrR family transcriptional regulator
MVGDSRLARRVDMQQQRRRDSPLTPARIVEAAVELSKQSDRNALSARRLGERLGVDPTAVYRHFASMDELVQATLDAIWLDAVRLIPRSLSWRARLETIGHVVLQLIIDHPGVGVDAYRLSTNGPGEQSIIDLVLTSLEDAGLSDAQVVDFYAVLSSLVVSHGSAMAAQRIALGESSPTTERRWIEPQERGMDSFPALTRHLTALSALDNARVFELSLRLVLDVVEAGGK